MKKFLKFILSPFLGKTYSQGFFKAMFLLGLKGMNFGGGAGVWDSGEAFAAGYAIKKLAKKQLVIFDVGGNRGNYTKLWLKLSQSLGVEPKIYLFEPSAGLNEFLQKEFASNPEVTLERAALGETPGQAVLHADFSGSGLASLIKRDLSHVGVVLGQSETVPVQTLKDFCLGQKIGRVDFLKLDVEGFELSVLKGAVDLLKNKQISFIQFEFGGTDIDARVFFRDFYRLLEPDFKLYRILKNGLKPVENYSELDEIYITTNYLAELK